MKSFIFLCAILALFTAINCEWEEEFRILVKLSNETFEHVDGKLKLSVNGQNLNLNQAILKPNEYYETNHELDTKYDDLGENTVVEFHYTVPSKLGNLIKKPSIHLEKVSIALLGVRCPCIRFYCASKEQNPILPNQIVKLKYCGGMD